jgi:hypothetical protein
METYFKLKIFSEYIIPIIIVVLIITYALFGITKSWLRSRLMRKLGYRYEKGLGTNVSYEFQPHWKKGKTKIHYRKIESLKYFKIKEFVKSKEEN